MKLSELLSKKIELLKQQSIPKLITIALVLIYSCIILHTAIFKPLTYDERDTNVLPTFSLLRFSLTTNMDDLRQAKECMPELYSSNINSFDDLRSAKLRYIDENHWYTYYFHGYNIACIPILLILKLFHLPQYRTFSLANAFLIIIALFFLLKKLKADDLTKLFIIGLIICSPILFYVNYICYESYIFSLCIISMVYFANKCYKRSALFLCLASWPNPTIMAAGFVMILVYICQTMIEQNTRNPFKYLACNIKPLFFYALSFTPCFIPFICTSIILGNNIFIDTATKNGLFQRFWAYITDLNLGIASFSPFVLAISLLLVFLIIKNKLWFSFSFLGMFVFVVAAYSLNMHINCGMVYCARYIQWSYPMLCFFVGYNIRELVSNKRITTMLVTISCLSSIGIITLNCINWNMKNYVSLNYVSTKILNRMPWFYNPLHSTFNSRVNHIDGGYSYSLPIIYTENNGYFRKVLVDSNSVENLKKQISGNKSDLEWFYKKCDKVKKEQYISVPRSKKIFIVKPFLTDTQINFNDNDGSYNANQYVLLGISSNEHTFTWSEGKKIKFHPLRLNNPGGGKLFLSLDVLGVFYKPQRITIKSNGIIVYDAIVGNQKNIFVPLSVDENNIVKIEIDLPDALSPKSVGVSEDGRDLAIQLRKMSLLSEKIFVSSLFPDMEELSDEEFIRACYRRFLKREPDEGGFATHLNDLLNGKTREQKAHDFFSSEEFRAKN